MAQEIVNPTFSLGINSSLFGSNSQVLAIRQQLPPDSIRMTV
ncbi:hypothetical protein CES85_4450 [Ochrobactrum quorumnocens]|uniref:Uncharacterized protein n=1 Tax=Ochrobactrum quorumnocens TaxID=271865 RepID=A0A248UAD9_9HYPH|nr:hypothetical protein CES85_4450 [[Ochrobactrum] quorumnocens]